MQISRLSLAIVAALMISACPGRPVPVAPEPVAVPASTPAEGPRLSGGGDLPLLLSWMEPDDSGHSLLYASYENGAWSEPQTVVAGIDMFVNWADMPSVQPMGNDRLSAHWLEMSANLTYAYDVVFAQSRNGGETWSDPIRPHDDGTPTEHGFVSMYTDDAGTGLIWLDGRKTGNEANDDPVATGMTLRAATISEDMAIHDEQLVDELICDCCQTDVAIAASGPVAVYRDRSVDEIRDISISRHVDGRWQPGRPVANDAWEIPGCPVNGPAIIADETLVAVAWFTAVGDEPAVKLAMSGDNGQTFSWQLDIDRGAVLGRVGLTLLPWNRVAVSWLHKSADGLAELRAQSVGMGGHLGDVRVLATGVSAYSVPQSGISENDLVFVWTERMESGHSIHSARVPADTL